MRSNSKTSRNKIRIGVLVAERSSDAHPLILKAPEPMATFDGFGASLLDFTLRCFLPNMEKRLLTIHELNTAINRKFAAAKLEMAYPQTDVYVKSWPECWPQPGVRAGKVFSKSHGNGHG